VKRSSIVLRLARRERLVALARRTKDAGLRTRCLIVIHTADGLSKRSIAAALSCDPRTVGRVRRRFLEAGEAGLADRRAGNGKLKADAAFDRQTRAVLRRSPRACGHRRPAWTLALLAATLGRRTGARVSESTMSRVLRRIGARLGRPRPAPPTRRGWPAAARDRRLVLIRRLIDTLPDDQACFWEDEIDIDLNPRIGADWMLRGTQKRVVTPGLNVKRYVAGALDAKTGRLTWVRGRRKNSELFVALLTRLLRLNPDRRVIHVVLDNYAIHFSKKTRLFLASRGGRIRLHPLPPYCPDDNAIERRVWRETHRNVTLNHDCESIDELMHRVDLYLRRRNRAAVRAESREAI
jgi:transposase